MSDPADTDEYTFSLPAGTTATKPGPTWVPVRFQGRDLFVEAAVLSGEKAEGPLAPSSHIVNGELCFDAFMSDTFAHIVRGGDIKRYMKTIGHLNDLLPSSPPAGSSPTVSPRSGDCKHRTGEASGGCIVTGVFYDHQIVATTPSEAELAQRVKELERQLATTQETLATVTTSARDTLTEIVRQMDVLREYVGEEEDADEELIFAVERTVGLADSWLNPPLAGREPTR